MQQPQPQIVSFRNPDDSWVGTPDLIYNAIYFGPTCDPMSPAAAVFRAGPDVGDRIAGARTHSTTTMTVVLEGSVQLDGRWMRLGDIQLAPAGLVHGDLVVGPDGATVFVMFAERAGMIPRFIDPGDQKNFDVMTLRDAEVVASGAGEPVFALLPRRDSYSSRRGIMVTDNAEAARLIAESADRW
jgi:hypothetical protein